ncbi:MAG: hypothetical protein OXF88_00645 [Rhodobacteraceae bacterium]|nr:hypothetical protein [Paracoccaceae bacterium]
MRPEDTGGRRHSADSDDGTVAGAGAGTLHRLAEHSVDVDGSVDAQNGRFENRDLRARCLVLLRGVVGRVMVPPRQKA